MFSSLEIQYQPIKERKIHPSRLALVASQNMASISINTGNCTFVEQKYTQNKQCFPKDYKLILSNKTITHLCSNYK